VNDEAVCSSNRRVDSSRFKESVRREATSVGGVWGNLKINSVDGGQKRITDSAAAWPVRVLLVGGGGFNPLVERVPRLTCLRQSWSCG
jgi:hypothetical protein